MRKIGDGMLENSPPQAKSQKQQAKLTVSSENMRHIKEELIILRNSHLTNKMII